MGTYAIQRVTAVQDVIDRLDWTARFATGFYRLNTQQIFILHWEGTIAFYREPIGPGITPGPKTPKMSLSARWTNRVSSSRVFAPTEQTFELTTELPGAALDRIERFREGGRLYARIEGSLYLIEGGRGTGDEWLQDLIALFGPHRVLSYDIRSEPFELTRDIWCGEVLATLRPPGKRIIEVTIPVGTTSEDGARRAIEQLNDARRAFDEGRYAEVARLCYPALEELEKLGDRVEQRYGKYGKDRLFEQAKVARSLCNPARHGTRSDNADFDVDRTLAEHMLAFTSSVAGVILQ